MFSNFHAIIVSASDHSITTIASSVFLANCCGSRKIIGKGMDTWGANSVPARDCLEIILPPVFYFQILSWRTTTSKAGRPCSVSTVPSVVIVRRENIMVRPAVTAARDFFAAASVRTMFTRAVLIGAALWTRTRETSAATAVSKSVFAPGWKRKVRMTQSFFGGNKMSFIRRGWLLIQRWLLPHSMIDCLVWISANHEFLLLNY